MRQPVSQGVCEREDLEDLLLLPLAESEHIVILSIREYGDNVRIVELRSDTKTQPTPEMRKAMAEAEVGDMDAGEDPTVNRLEAMAARMLGKEEAVFVTSGTQGNLAAVLAQCTRGTNLILGKQTHIYLYEASGIASIAEVSLHPLVNTENGSLDSDKLASAINLDTNEFAKTSMIALENTQNLLGGLALTPQDTRKIADIAHGHNLPLHIDGARLFNAAVHLNIPALELVEEADSVTFCLSKGLSAPVGSMLCGSHETIAEARRWCKMLGASMRQAGIIAAGGIVALETMVDRLVEDHENARRLAKGLVHIPGLELDADNIQTNLVFCKITNGNSTELCARIAERGVRLYDLAGDWRFATHGGVTADDVDYAIDIIGSVMREV